MLRRFVVLVFVALAAMLLSTGRHSQSMAFGSPGIQREKLKDPQSVADGSKLFATSCGNAYCHGTGGVGGGAPGLRGKGLESGYLFKTISNGIPGTGMLGFKAELSEEQMWKVIAFVTSDAKTGAEQSQAPVPDRAPSSAPPVLSRSSDTGVDASLTGDSAAGKALFFDSAQPKSCHSCHSFAGEGTPIGPDLSKLGSRSARDLFLSVILPRDNKDSRYSTVSLSLKNGDKITGVKKDEDAESIRVYDTTELPAVLRTVQRSDVIKVESRSESVMPKSYASIYTMKQLLDLVTLLKSSESKSPVTLKDLVQ